MKIFCIHLKLTLREAIDPQRWKRWIILNCNILFYVFIFSPQTSWNINISSSFDTMNRWKPKSHFIPCSVRFIWGEHLSEAGRLFCFQILIFRRRDIGQSGTKMIVSWAAHNLKLLGAQRYLMLDVSRKILTAIT